MRFLILAASLAALAGCAHPGVPMHRGDHLMAGPDADAHHAEMHARMHGQTAGQPGPMPPMTHGARPGMRPGGHAMMGGMMMAGPLAGYDWLGLTDAQRADADRIRDPLRRQHWDLMGKMREERIAIGRLERAQPRDVAAIGAAYDRLGALRKEMATSLADARNRIEALLTPDQRKRLDDLRARMRGPGMMRPGMGPGMMQPGTMQPGTIQPGMMQPGTIQPGMMQPGTMQPGMMQPGTMQPGMMRPGMTAPGAPPPR